MDTLEFVCYYLEYTFAMFLNDDGVGKKLPQISCSTHRSCTTNGLKLYTSLTCLLLIFKPVIVIFFFSGHNMYIDA